MVDVRDIAAAHRLAMETPAAGGNRCICAGEHMWIGEIAAVLAAEFRPRGYPVPTLPLPYWLMWMLARFDPTSRPALDYVGVPALVSADRARRELGWTARSARASTLAAGESLLRYGVVRRRGADPRTDGGLAVAST